MSSSSKRVVVVLGAMLLFFVANYTIYSKEMVLKNGKRVYLELAPRDPRSLMQGDYMRLDFKLRRDIQEHIKEIKKESLDRAVVDIDSRDVAEFSRLYRGERLKDSELLMKFKVTSHGIKLATDSFFFEEGKGKKFQDAKFGEFRVDQKNGEMILVTIKKRLED